MNHWKKSCKSSKKIHFISTEVMNDVIKIKMLPEYLGVLKHGIKKQEILTLY